MESDAAYMMPQLWAMLMFFMTASSVAGMKLPNEIIASDAVTICFSAVGAITAIATVISLIPSAAFRSVHPRLNAIVRRFHHLADISPRRIKSSRDRVSPMCVAT